MRKRILPIALTVLGLGAAIAAPAATAALTSGKADAPVKVQVFAPRPGDAAGEASKGFVIDLAAQYPTLASSGADLQLTGPAAHQNQAPFPGAFSPVSPPAPGRAASTMPPRLASSLAPG